MTITATARHALVTASSRGAGRGKKLVATIVLATALAAMGLQRPAAASTDLQHGDFVVGVNGGGRGAIVRVRNGVAATYCESQTTYQFGVGYFDTPTEVVVDLQGRVVFLAFLRTTSGNGLGPWGLWRCDTMGEPPTLLAAFGANSTLGYPDPLNGRSVRWAGGLHLKRTAGVNLNSATATDTSYYVLAVSDDFGAPVNTIAYQPETGEWGEMEDPIQTQHFFAFDMISAGDGLNSYTVSAAQGALKVIAEPVKLEFNIADELILSLAFQSARTLENAVIDDVTVGNVDPSCSSLFPGVPRNSAWTGNVMSGIHGVAWADNKLVLISDNLGAGHNYLPNISMVLFNIDPSDDNEGLYARPAGLDCPSFPKLQHTPWHPFNSYWDSFGVSRYAGKMTPDGTAGSQRNEGRIVGVGPAQDVLIHAEGLTDPTGIDRYPGFKPKVGGLSLFIKIESPVNVVITAPDGRRIGADLQTGLPLNEFGPGGYDSNTDEPHVYGIRNPMAGDYKIDTIGTGVGPFHITTYGVNLETMAVTKATFAGNTEPGQTSEHEFALTPAGTVASSGDHEPPAIVGAANLTVDATGPLTEVTYPGLSAIDNLDPAPMLTCAPASGSQFAPGPTSVVCTATDGAGNSATAAFTVTVVDKTPPVVTPTLTGVTANGWYRSSASVTWSVTDPESGIASRQGCDGITLTADTAATTVTCEATNGAGLETRASVTVRIDMTAPAMTCGLNLPVLWPPNHRMVPTRADVTVRDALSGAGAFSLAAVTSSEPDAGSGNDDRPGDIQGFTVGTPDLDGELRAERSGKGAGRTYLLRYTATDAAGNAASCQTTATVPHDNRKQ